MNSILRSIRRVFIVASLLLVTVSPMSAPPGPTPDPMSVLAQPPPVLVWRIRLPKSLPTRLLSNTNPRRTSAASKHPRIQIGSAG